MRSKASWIVFAVSFLPLLLCVTISFICGGGFLSNFIFAIWFFIFYIPVFPACLIVQISCLLRINGKMRRISVKKYIVITIAITITVCGGLALFFFRDSIANGIGRQLEKSAAVNMYKNAEQKLTYNESTFYSGILGIDEVVHDTVLIDYDKHETGFLFGGSHGEFWKAELKKTAADSYDIRKIQYDYLVQCDVPLSAPGKRLVTFCEDDTLQHRTVAMIMETEDGFWFADDIREKDTGYSRFNGFHWSHYYVGKGVKYSDL